MKDKILTCCKAIWRWIFSIKCTIILLLLYGFLCGIATFIENDFGVQDARNLIYNTTLFDVVHLCLVINLIGVFCYAKPWKRKKYASLLFHSSLIVIVLGAGITRYFGFEGSMHIREGQTSDIVITQDEYIIVLASIDGNLYRANFPIHISGVHEYAELYRAYLPSPIASFCSLLFNRQIPFAFQEQNIPLGDSTIQVRFKDYQPAQPMISPQPMLLLEVTYKGESTQVALVQNYIDDTLEPFVLGDAEFALSWGPRPIQLPFGLHLQEFEIQKYPGSTSPSSYASEVIIEDNQNNVHEPYRIFMNNVLDYRGYRFFQSSYDEDEQGTILSVNKDPGKIPTYIGYTMLIIGLVWNLFTRNGRFYGIYQYLKKQQLFSIAFVCWAMSISYTYATDSQAESSAPSLLHSSVLVEQIDSKQNAQIQPQEQAQDLQNQALEDEFIKDRITALSQKASKHSRKFGELIVQDFQGRNKPLDTLAMDYIHKITKQNTLFGLDHTELFLGMLLYYEEFARVKIIATSTPKLREIIGVPKDKKFISISDVYSGNFYKLSNYVEDANRKNPSLRDAFDKDVLSVDERVNIALAILNTNVLRIFPDSHSNAWLDPADAIMSSSHEEAARIREVLESYFTNVDAALINGDWSKADAYLLELKEMQKAKGSDLIPSNLKIQTEIMLNHSDVFNRLGFVYIIIGLVLFIGVFIAILRNKPLNQWFAKVFVALIVLSVIIHTIGLILRWYVGGHAPWSNAYESMIYIAWCGIVAGVIVLRKSLLTLSMASLVAGITLFVAHLGFMDPQIGNLMPVLKSYWLNIHVSVITASYGFLTLCFMIGVVSLLLFTLRSPSRPQIDTTITNLYCINEISMILGISFLTIGNFLGGVWANESWGRYWGWDPKETWALISIVVYVIVLHARFIPRCNTPFAFAALSTIAFYSILMTYFGVNFYLSGKHSYAAGESAPIPIFLYVIIGINILLIIVAWLKRGKLASPKF